MADFNPVEITPEDLDRYKKECMASPKMLLRTPKPTILFTWDEVKKLIKAYEEKYNISPCDALPYEMKSIDVILSGEIVK